MNHLEICCSWILPESEEEHKQLTDFIMKNINTNYISFSEVLYGYAEDERNWSTNASTFFMKKLNKSKKDFKIAVVKNLLTQEILALSITEMLIETFRPHAWIHDFIVSEQYRGQKIGSELMRFLEYHFIKNKIYLVVLESGIRNEDAHHFFEQHDFRVCSKVMIKQL